MLVVFYKIIIYDLILLSIVGWDFAAMDKIRESILGSINNEENMNPKLIKIFLSALVVFSILSGCSSDSDSHSGWNIKYEVVVQDSYEWNNIYGITYNDNTGNEIWVGDGPDSPWTHEFRTDKNDLHVYIIGYSGMCDGPCPDFTTLVTVKVYINNILYQSKTDSNEGKISAYLYNLISNGPNNNCTLGETQSCTCIGGGDGVQTCNQDNVWNDCTCNDEDLISQSIGRLEQAIQNKAIVSFMDEFSWDYLDSEGNDYGTLRNVFVELFSTYSGDLQITLDIQDITIQGNDAVVEFIETYTPEQEAWLMGGAFHYIKVDRTWLIKAIEPE